MNLPRFVLACVLAVCLPPAGAVEAARVVSLTNGRVTAQFDARGLTSLGASDTGPAVRFPQDDFAVTIDGTTIEGRTLALPVRVVAKDRVTYTWSSPPYRIVVVYELAAGWRFLGKQIAVEGGAKPFRAGEVVVFASSVVDPISNHFVPKSARPNLGTGDYGACLRFDKGRGLLVVAQNPFLEFRRDAQAFSLRYKPDLEEYKAFSDADRQWFRRWIDWTAANKEVLRHTRTIVGQPAIGKIDGTAAIDGDRGFIFLFNPNGRRLDAEFSLDVTIGFNGRGFVQLKEVYPLENRLVGKPGGGLWSAGDRVSLSMDGGSAVVLEVQPAAARPSAPLLFGSPGTVTFANGVVSIEGVRGEAGTTQELLVLRQTAPAVSEVRVNGQPARFTRRAAGLLSIPVAFDGAPFRQYQQIGAYDPAFEGGRVSSRFTVPQRVFDQLAARQKAWPIPWTAEDYRTTWLAPERLLLFVQIAEPDPAWEARLKVDGRVVELRKAYSAVRTAPRTFVGFYADLSLLAADREHTLELELPRLRPGQLQGVFFDNIEPEYTNKIRRMP
jgi:hypothetical protein